MSLSERRVTTTIPVRDLREATDWYTGKLGLEVAASNQYQVIFACGDGTSIQVYESPTFTTASLYTLCTWEVPDIDAALNELRECGVVFEEYDFEEFTTVNGVITESDGSKAAWFKDPSGNVLCLHQAA